MLTVSLTPAPLSLATMARERGGLNIQADPVGDGSLPQVARCRGIADKVGSHQVSS
jgi:hypothetical protein